jgi:hypothetical protein
LLAAEHKEALAQWLPNKQFKLIYRASRYLFIEERRAGEGRRGTGKG